MKPLLCLSALLLFATCRNVSPNNPAQRDIEGWAPPPAGTIIAADSMKVDDPLNDFYFAVKLTSSADNEGANGDYGFVYDIDTHYGPGLLQGKINMPAGGKNLKPLLRKDAATAYKYIIGFIAGKDLGGDGRTFQELYSITGSKETVEIKPLKSYRFQ